MNHDIFFLEVCTLSEVCHNSDELFELEDAKGHFECDFSLAKFRQLQQLLLEPPMNMSAQNVCYSDAAKDEVEVSAISNGIDL